MLTIQDVLDLGYQEFTLGHKRQLVGYLKNCVLIGFNKDNSITVNYLDIMLYRGGIISVSHLEAIVNNFINCINK